MLKNNWKSHRKNAKARVVQVLILRGVFNRMTYLTWNASQIQRIQVSALLHQFHIRATHRSVE